MRKEKGETFEKFFLLITLFSPYGYHSSRMGKVETGVFPYERQLSTTTR